MAFAMIVDSQMYIFYIPIPVLESKHALVF